MKIHRSLTALIFSFGFLFVVMSLLGNGPVPIARAAPQAAPPARSVLAPLADPVLISETPLLTLTGEATSNYFGQPVASAGDVNGDGFADVLIGAYRYNSFQGRAYLYLGGPAGLSTTPALTLTGKAANDEFGYSVASAGDVNGDGFADVLVSAYGYNSFQGCTYLYLGGLAGLSVTPAITLTGEAAYNYFGWSVASAGDVNGDGFAEIIVGAYNYLDFGKDHSV